MSDLELQELLKELVAYTHELEDKLQREHALQEELLNRNCYLQTLVNNTLDITMVLQPDKSIYKLNGPVNEIIGREPDELVGTSILDLIHPNDKKEFEEQLDELIKNERKRRNSQLLFMRKDGGQIVLECACRILQTPQGYSQILINTRDITEWVAVHKILENSRNQLLLAQKIARIGSWEWDYEQDVLQWSNELQHIFGISQLHNITSFAEFEAFIDENDHAELKASIEQAIETHSFFEAQFKITNSDGNPKIIHTKGEIIRDDGRAKIIAMAQDITGLKNAEEKLREYSRQLQHFSARQDRLIENERNQIARTIHDDIGQMLAVLKLDMFLLKENVKNDLDEKSKSQYRDDMQNIFQRFDLLVKTVQDITENLRPEVIHDLGLAEAIKWLCKDFEKQSGISCTFIDKSDRLNDMLLEYKNTIFRIVQQGLANIQEHREATKARVCLEFTGQELNLTISDNGKGTIIDNSRHPNAMGMLSMQERSHYLGGKFSISESDASLLSLQIPVNEILFKS